MSHSQTQYPHPTKGELRYKEIRKVTLIGSFFDLALGVGKILGGLLASSQALIADGIHSLSDLATDLIVIYAAKHSHKEADAEHPYGHGRFETLATVILGVALIIVATGIGIDAPVASDATRDVFGHRLDHCQGSALSLFDDHRTQIPLGNAESECMAFTLRCDFIRDCARGRDW
jgi:hypothetical protein